MTREYPTYGILANETDPHKGRVLLYFYWSNTMAIDKCIHVAKNPEIPTMRVTAQSDGIFFDLCADCHEIWNNDKRRNPAESEGYYVYRSIDPDLPKDQWLRLNDKPIPRTASGHMEYRDKTAMPGAVYYIYIITVNAIGLESHPSEVIKIGDSDEEIDIG
jgi:hypothetical protein